MADSSLISHFVTAFLPPDLAATINTHILHPNSPLQTLKRQLLLTLQNILDAALPILQPLLDKALVLMAENQGVVGSAIGLLLLALAVIVLNWIRRIMLWWTRLTMRIATWAAVIALAAWVYERGVFESVKDVVVVGSKVGGYLAVLKEVWLDEYNKYEAQQGMGGRSAGRGRGR